MNAKAKAKLDEFIRQLKVALKALVKGLIIVAAGILARKFGATDTEAIAIAAATHPLIKIVDPTDNSIGFNLKK